MAAITHEQISKENTDVRNYSYWFINMKVRKHNSSNQPT